MLNIFNTYYYILLYYLVYKKIISPHNKNKTEINITNIILNNKSCEQLLKSKPVFKVIHKVIHSFHIKIFTIYGANFEKIQVT